MQPNLQRRIQRYGWDLAADTYEPLWQSQLACAQTELLSRIALKPGEHVLDIACGTGLIALRAAEAVGPSGRVLGTDISGLMVDAARRRAQEQQLVHADFVRMGAEALALPDASFDVAMCALGFMYFPDPEQAIREMRRVVRPGGRVGIAVWGERSACGWSPVFPIVDAEVSSEVCPLFFSLGQQGTLAHLCAQAGLGQVESHRITTKLHYPDADEACDAAFIGGPVALAWSRFDAEARARVRASYTKAIEPWRNGHGYQIPGEFVIVTASV